VLRILDHSSIYILIAGTYTPFCVINMHNDWGFIFLFFVWLFAVCGVSLEAFFMDMFPVLSVCLYVAMGWMILLMLIPAFRCVEIRGLIWMAAGGIAYTSGVYFYVKGNLHHPIYHTIWHIFVFVVLLAVWSWSIAMTVAYSDTLTTSLALTFSLFLGDFGISAYITNGYTFEWTSGIGIILICLVFLWLLKRLVTLNCPNSCASCCNWGDVNVQDEVVITEEATDLHDLKYSTGYGSMSNPGYTSFDHADPTAVSSPSGKKRKRKKEQLMINNNNTVYLLLIMAVMKNILP